MSHDKKGGEPASRAGWLPQLGDVRLGVFIHGWRTEIFDSACLILVDARIGFSVDVVNVPRLLPL